MNILHALNVILTSNELHATNMENYMEGTIADTSHTITNHPKELYLTPVIKKHH